MRGSPLLRGLFYCTEWDAGPKAIAILCQPSRDRANPYMLDLHILSIDPFFPFAQNVRFAVIPGVHAVVKVRACPDPAGGHVEDHL